MRANADWKAIEPPTSPTARSTMGGARRRQALRNAPVANATTKVAAAIPNARSQTNSPVGSASAPSFIRESPQAKLAIETSMATMPAVLLD